MGPPSPLSIPLSYPQGGSSQSSESIRTRGRNRSSGSSSASSREHSVEGRGGDNRRGSLELRGVDFRASYHNQYKGPGRVQQQQQEQEYIEHQEKSGSRYPQFARETTQGVFGGGKLGIGRDGGTPSPKLDSNWLNRSRGHHGQGPRAYADEGGLGVGSSSSHTITRGYSLTIKGDPWQQEGQGQDQGWAQGHDADNDYYGGGRRISRQENGYMGAVQRQGWGSQRMSGSQWQDSAFGGGGHENRVGGGGSGRMSMAGGWNSNSGSSRGRHSRVDRGHSKDGVFGDGPELQAFGSSNDLSRNVKEPGPFLPLRRDGSSQWGKSSTRNGRGDLRRTTTDEGIGRGERWGSRNHAGSATRGSGHAYSNSNSGLMQRANSDGGRGFNPAGEQHMVVYGSAQQPQQFFPGMEQPQMADSRKASKRMSSRRGPNSSFKQGSFDGWSEFQEEAALSKNPSVTSSKGSFSRKNSVERKKRSDAESPVFTPRSFSRNSSLDGRHGRDSNSRELAVSPQGSDTESASAIIKSLSRESSVSESSRQDLDGWNAAAQLTSGSSRGWGSAMPGTRVTDWYEICLQEEEAEALRVLAKRSEIQEMMSSSRTGSSGRSTPAAREGRDHLDMASLHERLGGGGTALDHFSHSKVSLSGGRNATTSDSAGPQMLFTPWNAQLQFSPTLKSGPLQVNQGENQQPFRQYDKSSVVGDWRGRDGVVHNDRISLAGGRQAVGRAARRGAGPNAAAAAAEPEKWRPDSRAQARNLKGVIQRDGSRGHDGAQELTEATRKGASRATADVDSASALQQQQQLQRSEIERPLASAIVKPQSVMPQASSGVRASAFYQAFNNSDAGADEDLLPHISGTCPDMCPVKERLQRERLRDLTVFERISGDTRKMSKDLAVKKLLRSLNSQTFDRCLLWRTQQYLMGLLDDPEFAFDIIHNFLFDRTRAIRQELGMQRIDNHQSVTLYEEMVRFHILSQHELRNLNRKRTKQVDTHLNLQQLSKSLHSLLNLYTRLGGRGDVFENEAEFYGYYVLLNIGNHGECLSLWFPNVPLRLRNSDPVRFARKALRLYRSNNYVGFFRVVTEASYLQSCLLELSFDSLRATALAAINASAYKLHPYPLSDLAHMLVVTEGEVGELCRHYGLVTGRDNSSQQLCLLPKQAQFAVPEREERPQLSCPVIDKRASTSFLEVKGAAARGNGSQSSLVAAS